MKFTKLMDLRQSLLASNSNVEPPPDIAICDECEWQGKVSECDKDTEGDWETGYYSIDVCPKCSGPVEYDMSDAQGEAWLQWHKKQGAKYD